MSLIFIKTKNSVVDEESGMALSPKGWFDDGDSSFGFHDPNSQARSSRGSEWFYFSAGFLLETNPSGKRAKPIGYRIDRGKLRRSLSEYAGPDMGAYRRAEEFIIAALKMYMRTLDGLADPIVELT
jgi:hypothetical protein